MRSFRSGFTLVELTVVVGIMVFLAVITIGYSGRSRARNALFIEQARVSEVILRARGLALATYGERTTTNTTNVCGYGFSVDYSTQQFGIFSYTKDQVTNTCTLSSHNGIDTGRMTQFVNSLYTLNESVRFKLADPIVCGSKNLSALLFVPPDPQIFMNIQGVLFGDATCVVDEGRILMETADGAVRATIVINRGGQLSYE